MKHKKGTKNINHAHRDHFPKRFQDFDCDLSLVSLAVAGTCAVLVRSCLEAFPMRKSCLRALHPAETPQVVREELHNVKSWTSLWRLSIPEAQTPGRT